MNSSPVNNTIMMTRLVVGVNMVQLNFSKPFYAKGVPDKKRAAKKCGSKV